MSLLRNIGGEGRITSVPELYFCRHDGAVEKVLALHKSNRLRHIIIQPTCRGRPVCLPLSAVLHSCNRLRRMVLVSINRVNECINRANQRVTGGHASPPLPLYGILFQQPQAATTPSGAACHPATGREWICFRSVYFSLRFLRNF